MFSWFLAVAMACCLLACELSPASYSGEDLGLSNLDQGGDADVSADATDAADAGETDGLDAATDVSEPPVRWLTLENPELWENVERCTAASTELSPLREGPFVIPDFEDTPAGFGSDIDDVKEFLEVDELPTFTSIVTHPRHEAGTTLIYDIYASTGDVVEFEIRVANERIPGPDDETGYETHTFLLDYEPVDATYRHLSPDRSRVIAETTSTGYSFEVAEPMSIIRVSFPSETFEPGRMHELSWIMTTGRVDGGFSTTTRRIPLFYGGYEPARESIPCAIPPLQAPATEVERRLLRQRGGAVVLLFTNPAPDLRVIQKVSPGETVRIYYSIVPLTLDGPHTVEITPTLDGRPIVEPQWVQHSAPGSRFDETMIDARGYFDVTFPTEPGLYLVGATATDDPYVRWRDLGSEEPARGFPDVRNAEVRSSALPRWFEVVE